MLKKFYDDREAAEKFVLENEDSVLHQCEDEFYILQGEMTADDLIEEMIIWGDTDFVVAQE
jgi:hypothetical protein